MFRIGYIINPETNQYGRFKHELIHQNACLNQKFCHNVNQMFGRTWVFFSIKKNDSDDCKNWQLIKKFQTSALHSRASRKNAADTKCFPTDSDNLIWASQYVAVSSLSNRHLLQFSAVWYGVLTLGLAAGVRGPSACCFAGLSATFSWKHTLFFFNLALFFSGSFFSSAVARDDFDCFWVAPVEGFIAGFSVSVFAGMFVLRLVPKARFSLKQRSE